MPRDEPERRLLLHHDVYDVLTVQVAGMTQERLLAPVVVFREELELRRVIAMRVERNRLRERPSRERARRILDVVLRVVADAHAEQLKQLAAPVLVRLVGVILTVVQPVVHRGVSRKLQQNRLQVCHADFTEHVDLADDRRAVLALVPSRRKDVVPEQGHLLLQWSAGVYHPPHPSTRPQLDRIVVRQLHVVALQRIFIQILDLLRMKQVLDHVFIRSGR